jgi:hypothetical protein
VIQFLTVPRTPISVAQNSQGTRAMSESKTYKADTTAARDGGSQLPGTGSPAAGKPVRAGNGWDYASWLNRGQKPNGRHAAITKSLYTWSNYKSWADKVRSSWDDDK